MAAADRHPCSNTQELQFAAKPAALRVPRAWEYLFASLEAMARAIRRKIQRSIITSEGSLVLMVSLLQAVVVLTISLVATTARASACVTQS